MDELLKAFRSEATEVRPGAGRKFPKALIAAGGRYARARREVGASWTAIATELEVGAVTVRRWAEREASGVSTFHRVTVVERATRSDFAAVLPGGVRIEGLDVAAIVQLARALS